MSAISKAEENYINISDYILPDIHEIEYKKQNTEEAYKEHLGVRRGFRDPMDLGYDNRVLAEYVKKRTNIVKVDDMPGVKYIYNFKKHIYQKVSNDLMGNIIIAITDEYDVASSRVVDVPNVDRLIGYLTRNYITIEKDVDFLPFPNGQFNLNTFTFDTSFSYPGIFTSLMPFEYDSAADCPVFKKCLSDAFCDDDEIISIIQEWMGYTFDFGNAKADRFMYFYGKGRNSKSLIGNVLTQIHGVENVSSVPLDKLGARFSLAALDDMHINICNEVKTQKIIDTSTLKALSGKDLANVEHKYRDAKAKVIWAKIMAMSNHYLRLSDNSLGMWERIITIPFNVTFLHANELGEEGETQFKKLADTNLSDKLKDESAGIFNFCIEGLKRLRDNGYVFTQSKACEELKNIFWIYNQPVATFVERCVISGDPTAKPRSEDSVMTTDLLSAFLNWADNNGIEADEYEKNRIFHREMREALKNANIPFSLRKSGYEYYCGFHLHPDYLNL